jgi:hypothetical protein
METAAKTKELAARTKLVTLIAQLVAASLLLLPASLSAQPAPVKPDYAGAWAIWGFQKFHTIENPWLRGAG